MLEAESIQIGAALRDVVDEHLGRGRGDRADRIPLNGLHELFHRHVTTGLAQKEEALLHERGKSLVDLGAKPIEKLVVRPTRSFEDRGVSFLGIPSSGRVHRWRSVLFLTCVRKCALWVTLMLPRPSNQKTPQLQSHRVASEVERMRVQVNELKEAVRQTIEAVRTMHAQYSNVASMLPPGGYTLTEVSPMTFPRHRSPGEPPQWMQGWIPFNGRCAMQFWYLASEVPSLYERFKRSASPAAHACEIRGETYFRVCDYEATGSRAEGMTTKLIFAGHAVPRAFLRRTETNGENVMVQTPLVVDDA